ncbi:alpha-galactosidase [uncultured Schumannella sp.]|uniref:alpha-galactosidase n=1 Tax=uncultured Schumannella sp. TaxID=1195956 RepID=UPI0025F75D82|nr:alpha-galactosidase [uncultured Schumannella sp.]
MVTLVHLRTPDSSSSPTSVLVAVSEGTGGARIVHWGRRLSSEPDADVLRPAVAPSEIDAGMSLDLLPSLEAGWAGRPGIRMRRDGRAVWTRLIVASFDASSDGSRLVLQQDDPIAGVSVTSMLELSKHGLLLITHTVRNDGAIDLEIGDVAVVLPVPQRARELLDLTGRWCREAAPQRHLLPQGLWLRSSRHGRPGHDSPSLFAVGTPGFGFRHGEVWASHLGWSGNQDAWAERRPSAHTVLGAAEVLDPGEVILASGQVYETPTTYAAYSAVGMDGVSAAFHGWLRARPAHPSSPRPVVVNAWEAVGFDHDLGDLTRVADDGARAGAELFMLDDGWFRGRVDDTAGLGDWAVDLARWPDGLAPLADHVHGLGMKFGLWFEPEMVNENSDLARAHPEWIARLGPALPPRWRHQQTVDLTHPAAWQQVFESIDAVITASGVDYLKWDQNRDPMVAFPRGQTLAVYRMMDALKAAHSGLEIESCSAGGARIDLGVLAHADRVWPTDTNDALERENLQGWIQVILPPELVGTQIGQARAIHTTGRTHDLGYRAATAFFGHLGFEWGAEKSTDGSDDSPSLARLIALYKRHRTLIHSGTRVRADLPDDAYRLHGVISPSRDDALYLVTAVTTSENELPGSAPLIGLDPDARYRVSVVQEVSACVMQRRAPAWIGQGVVTTGELLAELGLPLPAVNPEQALLLRVERSR